MVTVVDVVVDLCTCDSKIVVVVVAVVHWAMMLAVVVAGEINWWRMG